MRSSHQVFSLLQEAALVASSTNQACCTSGEFVLNWWIRGVAARAYMAIANGSPCVVPSVEAISPLPTITILTGVLGISGAVAA